MVVQHLQQSLQVLHSPALLLTVERQLPENRQHHLLHSRLKVLLRKVHPVINLSVLELVLAVKFIHRLAQEPHDRVRLADVPLHSLKHRATSQCVLLNQLFVLGIHLHLEIHLLFGELKNGQDFVSAEISKGPSQFH